MNFKLKMNCLGKNIWSHSSFLRISSFPELNSHNSILSLLAFCDQTETISAQEHIQTVRHLKCIWNLLTCQHVLKKLMRLFLPLLRISVSEICVHMYIGVSVCVQERVSVSVHVFPSVRIAVDWWHFATVLLIASWLLGGQLLDIRLVVMASVTLHLQDVTTRILYVRFGPLGHWSCIRWVREWAGMQR